MQEVYYSGERGKYKYAAIWGRLPGWRDSQRRTGLRERIPC